MFTLSGVCSLSAHLSVPQRNPVAWSPCCQKRAELTKPTKKTEYQKTGRRNEKKKKVGVRGIVTWERGPGSGDARGNGRTYPERPCPPLASRRLYLILYHKGRRAAKSPSCGIFHFLFLPFAAVPSVAVCWSCSSAAVPAAVHYRLSSATAPVPCCKSFAQHPFVVKEADLCFVCGKLPGENKSTAVFSSVVVLPLLLLLLLLLVLYTVVVGCPLSFSLLHLFFPPFCLAGSSKSVCIVHTRRRRTCCNLQARFGV